MYPSNGQDFSLASSQHQTFPDPVENHRKSGLLWREFAVSVAHEIVKADGQHGRRINHTSLRQYILLLMWREREAPAILWTAVHSSPPGCFACHSCRQNGRQPCHDFPCKESHDGRPFATPPSSRRLERQAVPQVCGSLFKVLVGKGLCHLEGV